MLFLVQSKCHHLRQALPDHLFSHGPLSHLSIALYPIIMVYFCGVTLYQ